MSLLFGDLLTMFSRCLSNMYTRLPVTCYLSSKCLVAHRASTERLHSDLSTAAALASAHDLHPARFPCFSTVCHQFVLGLHLFLFSSGAQVNALLQMLAGSPRNVCPINAHLLFIIIVLSFSILGLINSSSLLMCSCYLIFMILFKHFV